MLPGEGNDKHKLKTPWLLVRKRTIPTETNIGEKKQYRLKYVLMLKMRVVATSLMRTEREDLRSLNH
jgi:hypothetical protein